jgi:tetratricopeptide (TPR) repeat protein
MFLVDEVNPEFIEKYQKIYEADPKSRVFAPLAEAYRKMGLLREALELAEKGVRLHPTFAGGRVALGRIYLAHNKIEAAELEFKRAISNSPENILAHQLLAETSLRLKKTKEALKSYKMLLFLAPDNARAAKAVKKLESLTANEFDDDIFAMKPLKDAVKEWDTVQIESGIKILEHKDKSEALNFKYMERAISLADAFIARNDIDRALEALNEAERLYGADPEIVKRLKLIHQRSLGATSYPQSSAELITPPPRIHTELDNQIDFLQDLLQRIKQNSSHRNGL